MAIYSLLDNSYGNTLEQVVYTEGQDQHEATRCCLQHSVCSLSFE